MIFDFFQSHHSHMTNYENQLQLLLIVSPDESRFFFDVSLDLGWGV